MVDAIFTKWPHLCPHIMESSDVKSLWKLRLKSHFKNTRKRTPNIPQIAMRKVGKRNQIQQDNNNVNPKKKLCLSWAVPNFLPTLQDGEDQTSIQGHRNRLNQQYIRSKDRRDAELVKRLMNITFADRRKMLITDLETLNFIISTYPILCEEEQVLA